MSTDTDVEVPDGSQTIVALATAIGPGARGIIRVSGDAAVSIASRWMGEGVPVGPRTRSYTWSGWITLSACNARLPAEIYVWPTRRSYTRQPMVEIHTIPSPPLLEAMLDEICSCGARLARPGEFTLRAFLAGRIDLPQAEAILGTIDADNETTFRAALRQLAGGLSQPLHALRDDLLDLLADLEAGLDFVDEDIRFLEEDELRSRLQTAVTTIEAIVRQIGQRRTSGLVPRVVLCGPPNVGKSSLFNALTDRSASVVHASAGTTRDVVTHRCCWDGVMLELMDTAGVDDEGDHPHRNVSPLDRAAQSLTRDLVPQADLIICCHGPGQDDGGQELDEVPGIDASRMLLVRTKSDLGETIRSTRRADVSMDLSCSAKSGEGISQLRQVIRDRIAASDRGELLAATAVRCGESLRHANNDLHEAMRLAGEGAGDELVATELRHACTRIGEVTGTIYAEDLLDRVFSRFCIGK